MKSKFIYLIITIVVLAADQVSKAWATAWLEPHGSLPLIEGFFRLSYARNRGVAFSLFADSEFNMRWLLAAISAAAAVAVMVYLGRTVASNAWLNTALAFLLAGITGNLVDRVRLGEVVDFLDFHLGEHFTWPTFNIADAAICLGALLLALELIKEEKASSLKAQTPTPAAEESSIGPLE